MQLHREVLAFPRIGSGMVLTQGPVVSSGLVLSEGMLLCEQLPAAEK